MNKLFSNKKQEKGQGLVEYAIILALIAIVVVGTMTVLGKKVNNSLNNVSTALDGKIGSGPLKWGTDVFYNNPQVCAAAGVSSGGTAYTWGQSSSMNNGQTFYLTGSNTAPQAGYVQLGSTSCP